MASRRNICEREIKIDDVFCSTVNLWKPHKGKYSVLAVMDKAEDAVKIAEVQAAIYELAWKAWPDMEGSGGLTYKKKNGYGFDTVLTSWFQDGDKQTKPYYWNALEKWKPNPKAFGQIRVFAQAEHPPELYLTPNRPLHRASDESTVRQCFYRNQVLKRVSIVLTANDGDYNRNIAASLQSARCFE